MPGVLYNHPAIGPKRFLGHIVDATPNSGSPGSGEITFTIHYPPENHDVIVGLFRLDLQQFSFESSGPEWAFSAYLAGFEREMPHKDDLTAQLTFMVTGAPTAASQDPIEDRLARVERQLQRLLDHLSSTARLTA